LLYINARLTHAHAVAIVGRAFIDSRVWMLHIQLTRIVTRIGRHEHTGTIVRAHLHVVHIPTENSRWTAAHGNRQDQRAVLVN
jgi:hypothetical protein